MPEPGLMITGAVLLYGWLNRKKKEVILPPEAAEPATLAKPTPAPRSPYMPTTMSPQEESQIRISQIQQDLEKYKDIPTVSPALPYEWGKINMIGGIAMSGGQVNPVTLDRVDLLTVKRSSDGFTIKLKVLVPHGGHWGVNLNPGWSLV